MCNDNAHLREGNNLLRAQINSMHDNYLKSVPVYENTNVNASTRPIKPRKTSGNMCELEQNMDDDDVFYSHPQNEHNSDSSTDCYDTEDKNSDTDSSDDEIKSEIKEVKEQLKALTRQIAVTANANANANHDPDKPITLKRKSGKSGKHDKHGKKVKNSKNTSEKLTSDESSSNESEDDSNWKVGKFNTKLRYFEESSEEPWSDYVVHFKTCAKAMNWPKNKWAVFLGTQLKGKLLKEYNKIPDEKLGDFDYVFETLGRSTINYRLSSKFKLNSHQIGINDDFQKVLQCMEQETDLAYPNAPEDFKNEIIIERFMEALPLVIRDRLQPVMTMYQTPIDLAIAAETEKLYLNKTGRLNNKTITCGQISTHDGNDQNGGNNGHSSGYGHKSNNGKNWNNNRNNNRNFNVPKPTSQDRDYMRDKQCFNCGTMGHLAKFCRKDKNRNNGGNFQYRNGNQYMNSNQYANNSRNFAFGNQYSNGNFNGNLNYSQQQPGYAVNQVMTGPEMQASVVNALRTLGFNNCQSQSNLSIPPPQHSNNQLN